MSETRRVVYTNARLIDPASGFDGKGELLTAGATIEAMGFKGGRLHTPNGEDGGLTRRSR